MDIKRSGGSNGAGNRHVQRRLMPAKRRQQIIQAATEAISQYGFWGFSVRSVAEKMELTPASLLYYFKSKEGLLIAVLQYRDEVDMRNTARVLGVPFDRVWEEPIMFGLRKFCHTVVSRNATQMEMVRLYTILQAEALTAGHPAYDYFQRRESRTLVHFAKIAQHDGFHDPKAEAFDLLAAMDGIQLRWLHDPENIDLVEQWDAFADGRWSKS